ncbi:hypothetical protein OSTOST_15702, partial [Ostertagia ostertagi]
GAYGEFGAYVPEFVHIPAQLDVGIRNEFLRNGLHAEIVGEVADRKEACGIVLLDYTAYVDGDLFEAAVKPIEDYLMKADKNTVLNETLRLEVYKTMKATALVEHKAEMMKLFEMRRATTPWYRATELQFFPYAGVVALGIGMGLGGLIFKGVEHVFEESELRHYRTETQNKMKAIANTFVALINGITFQTSSDHFGLAFSSVRTQVYAQVHDTLDQLFGFGRVAEGLLERSSNRSLMSAIKRLAGAHFNGSLLALHGSGARDTIKATVIGMNMRTIEIKICYPTAMVSDVDYLVRVEPLGQFLPNMSAYWIHDVGGLYAIKKEEHKNVNLSKLKMVQDESLCRHSSSVMLCNLQEQVPGCGLLSSDRHKCELVLQNSTDEQFTLVRPLARFVIIATRATQMYEMPEELHNIQDPKVITKPVFAVEVPRGKWLRIGKVVVHSRVVQSEMGTDFKVIVPDTVPNYTPDASPHMASDSWISYSWISDSWMMLLWLITIIYCTMLYWKHCRRFNAVEREQADAKQWRDYFDNHRMQNYPLVPHIYD